MAAPSTPPPLRTLDALGMAGLALLTVLLGALIQRAFHPGLPVGMDLDLWSFGSLELGLGHPARVPPGYPALAALLSGLTGCDALRATTAVSAAALAAVPPLAWLLARRLGAGPGTAWLAAALPLLSPSLLFWGHQTTPDPLAAASFLLLALTAGRAANRPSAGNIALLFAATGWLYMLREHGLVVAVLVAILVAALPGSGRVRALRVAILLLLLWLLPVLAFHTPSLPTELPWWRRIGLVVEDLFASEPSWMGKRMAAGLEAHPIAIAGFALKNAPFAWAWLALAGLGALRLGPAARATLLVAVVPAMPALCFYSQPRHVLVVLPVAAALIAAAAARLGPRRWAAIGALAAAAALGAWHDWDSAVHRIQALTRDARHQQTLGRAICAHATPASMWNGELRSFTFCPLPHNPVEGPAHQAHWNTLWAASEDPGEPWERVELGLPGVPIYQIRVQGEARPCADSRPAPGTAYLSMEILPPTLVPPCEHPPPKLRRRPPPRPGGDGRQRGEPGGRGPGGR
jgi:hypothetical protein